MYESYFGFTTRPFQAAPLPDRYFPAASCEQARHALLRVVRRAEGPGLLCGPAGSGKSLLCQLLAQQLADDAFRVAVLACAKLSRRRDVLQTILFELNLPYQDLDENQMRLSLLAHLEPGWSCPRGLALIVDEAHTLPASLLDEIRMLTNFVRDGEPRIRLVLAGLPLLEEHLASPRLESLNQRLAARCYLQPFTREETCQYVRHELAAAGGDPDGLFEPSALDAVYRATDGGPRLVNQICDRALLLAAEHQRRPVDAALVEQAWADLQQLPPPAAAPASGPTDVLEFGELTDDEPPPSEDQEPDEASGEAPSAAGQGAPTDQRDADELQDVEPEGRAAQQNHDGGTGPADQHDEPADPVVLDFDFGDPEGLDQAAAVESDPASAAAPASTPPDEAADDATEPPSLSTADVCGRLERIERHVAALDALGADDAGPPAAGEAPRPAPASADAQDAFDGAFDEEEVVLDRFADRDGPPWNNSPRVSGPESGPLNAALLAIEPVWQGEWTPEVCVIGPGPEEAAPDRTDEAPSDEAPSAESSAADESANEPEAAGDPAPSVEDAGSTENDPASSEAIPIPFPTVVGAPEGRAAGERKDGGAAPGEDDRDLIIVEEADQPAGPLTAGARSGRTEYSQLFARLRGGELRGARDG